MNQETLPPFSIQSALRYGWTSVRANLWSFVELGAVGAFLALLNHELNGHPDGLASMLGLLVQILQAVVAMQFIRSSLDLYDQKPLDLTPRAAMLDDFLGYLLTSILYGLITGLGLLLLIVPGVIWGIKFGFATFLAVDRKLDPIAALRESARITHGAKLRLLELGLLLVGVNLLGAMALGIGLFVTIPLTFSAAAYALRHLQQRAGEREQEDLALAPSMPRPPDPHPGGAST